MRSRKMLFPLLAIAACLGLGLIAGARALGAQERPPDQAEGPEVLSGTYNCGITEYATPDPTSTFREINHSVNITRTGLNLPRPIGSGLRTPFPPRGGPGDLTSFTGLGSGASVGFNGGTFQDCHRLGEAVAAVAQRQGCVTSEVRDRETPYFPSVAFSFVCEGPASLALRTIAELDKAVVAQQL